MKVNIVTIICFMGVTSGRSEYWMDSILKYISFSNAHLIKTVLTHDSNFLVKLCVSATYLHLNCENSGFLRCIKAGSASAASGDLSRAMNCAPSSMIVSRSGVA